MSAPPRPIWLAGHPVSRRQLRRLSRQLADVGTPMAPKRLKQIAHGDPATPAELVDINFAQLTTGIRRSDRRSKRSRAQRLCLRWLIFAAAVVVALNALLCLGLLFFSLATHSLLF